MKAIRTMALGLALLASTAATVQAQEAQQQAGQGRGRGVAALLEGITLTADQQTKVDSIQKAFAPKLQTVRDEMMAARQNGGDASAAMTKMQTVNTELYTAVKTALTTEQQATFDKNVEARRQRMQNRGNPPR